MKTRVLIEEDHPKTLTSMASAVEAAEDMALVAAVPTLAEGLVLLAGADLVLVDLHLGEDSGLDLIAAAQGFESVST
jgi:DNA-binding NarL/FixJ family response regulator